MTAPGDRAGEVARGLAADWGMTAETRDAIASALRAHAAEVTAAAYDAVPGPSREFRHHGPDDQYDAVELTLLEKIQNAASREAAERAGRGVAEKRVAELEAARVTAADIDTLRAMSRDAVAAADGVAAAERVRREAAEKRAERLAGAARAAYHAVYMGRENGELGRLRDALEAHDTKAG